MQKLEVVVTTKNWSDAKNILATIDIDEKSKINYRPVDGLFIVSVEKQDPIADEIYEKIKSDPCISILSDSESRMRAAEVLDKVYDVETQLRKLLLHISDIVGVYFDIFSKHGKYTKDFVAKKAISKQDSLDPITSHLTLGEMKDILSTDLSWANKGITAEDLLDALNKSADLAALKGHFTDKLKPQTLWDVIAKNVLHSNTPWNDVWNDLKVLKEFRDASAHYQIITEKQKKKLIAKANQLIPKLTPPRRQPTKSELEKWVTISRSLSEEFARISEINAQIYKNLVPIVDSSIFKVDGEFLKGIKAIAGMSLPKINPLLYPALGLEGPKEPAEPETPKAGDQPKKSKKSDNDEGKEKDTDV